jgi:dTDP-4-dehydrorhamnose reductase
MKILVTGANGQLGSELKELSKTQNTQQFIFTDIDELDLTNFESTEKFISETKPDYLINCAAYTGVDKAESELEFAKLLNAEVPKELARISKLNNIKLIHISTDYVFSGISHTPLNEFDETNPPSVYGQTKLEGEKLVMAETDAIIIRTSWLYSKFGNNFVKSMLKFGNEREQLGVVFDQIGTPTSATNLASAILSIIDYCEENSSWKNGIYHYSNEGVCSWYDFAIEIMKFGKIDCRVNPIESIEYPLPAPRPSYSVMNKKKIRTTFDLSIPFWRDSLEKVVFDISNQG